MERARAEIIETGDPLLLAAQIEVKASARTIFDLLADPAKHALIDGSGSVKGALSGPQRLYLGAKFGMSMRIKVPYRITNEVVTFDEDRELAWRHVMRWEWRYKLTPIDDNRTLVREEFDARPSRSRRWLEMTGALKANPIMMAKTLVRLKEYVEG